MRLGLHIRHSAGHMAKQSIRALCLLLAVTLAAGGCASRKEKLTKPKRLLKLERITLSMADGANDDWPAAVELVRVEDAALVERLLGIDPTGWFDGAGNAFRQAHPEVHYDAWEVVPGTVVGPLDVKVDAKVAGVLFCDTSTPPAPLRFERNGSVTVRVEDAGCILDGGEPLDKPSFWERLSFWKRLPAKGD